jgi:hypothetical protein
MFYYFLGNLSYLANSYFQVLSIFNVLFFKFYQVIAKWWHTRFLMCFLSDQVYNPVHKASETKKSTEYTVIEYKAVYLLNQIILSLWLDLLYTRLCNDQSFFFTHIKGFFVVLGFELGALHLVSKHFASWAEPPALFCFQVIFYTRFCILASLDSEPPSLPPLELGS